MSVSQVEDPDWSKTFLIILSPFPVSLWLWKNFCFPDKKDQICLSGTALLPFVCLPSLLDGNVMTGAKTAILLYEESNIMEGQQNLGHNHY